MQPYTINSTTILKLTYPVQPRLIRFLGRKDVSFFCMFAAISIKTLLYLHFFQLEGDKLFQALGAINLVEGRGISFEHISALDLSTQIIEPVNRWPVSYSLLLAPFYWLTGNVKAACILIDFLSICAFFFVLFKLLNRLHFQPALINAILLYTGSTFGATLSKPTDLLACGGLFFACFLFLVFVSDRSKSASYGLVVGAAAVLPAAFRYMYIPCAIAIPAVLLWLGYRRTDKRIITGGIYAFTATFCLLAALQLLQKALVGGTTYIMASEKGFYPDNLLMLYPFIADAFLDINFTMQVVKSFTGAPFNFLFQSLQYLNLFFLGALLCAWFIFLIRRRPASWKPIDFFLIVSGVICGTLLLLLGFISVTNSSAPVLLRSPFPWTFVGDARYFLFPVLVLPIVAGFWLFNNRWLSRRIVQLFQLLFFILIAFQLAHTLYFIGKRLSPLGSKAGNVLITQPAESFLRNRIKQAKQDGYDVVLTGTDETVSNWATLNGEKGVLHVQELFEIDIRPAKASIVLVLIERKMLPFVQDKLTNKMFRIEKELDGLTIFSKNFASP